MYAHISPKTSHPHFQTPMPPHSGHNLHSKYRTKRYSNSYYLHSQSPHFPNHQLLQLLFSPTKNPSHQLFLLFCLSIPNLMGSYHHLSPLFLKVYYLTNRFGRTKFPNQHLNFTKSKVAYNRSFLLLLRDLNPYLINLLIFFIKYDSLN